MISSGMVSLFAQDAAKDDLKGAKDDVKEAGKATGKAAKKTGKAVKKTTKKVVNKSAEKTEKGADAVRERLIPKQFLPLHSKLIVPRHLGDPQRHGTLSTPSRIDNPPSVPRRSSIGVC